MSRISTASKTMITAIKQSAPMISCNPLSYKQLVRTFPPITSEKSTSFKAEKWSQVENGISWAKLRQKSFIIYDYYFI